MIEGSIRKKLLAWAAIAALAAACTSGGGAATSAPSAAPSESASAAPSESAAASPSAAAQYKIGYSNGGGVGNGFREEQVCTAKAEALKSGRVSELRVIHRNTDAAGQLQDIRDPNPQASDARPSAALVRIDRDPLEQAHVSILQASLADSRLGRHCRGRGTPLAIAPPGTTRGPRRTLGS